MKSLALPVYAQLTDADEAALTDLYRRGTPANTLRAWERDLAYIAAWKMASFERPLDWPEDEKVALRFILDHAQDLTEKPGAAQDVAMELIAIGLRRELTYMLPTKDALVAGRLLCEVFGPFRWQIATTATDANRFALRVARAVTGRPRVLVFKGCYHGTVDDAMVTRDARGRTVNRPGALPQSVWRRGSILALNSSGPARPYIARLRVFRRLERDDV